MKHTLISLIIIVFSANPCAAQWVQMNPGFVDNVTTMIVYDSALFEADQGSVLRYDSSVSGNWVAAESGIVPEDQGHIVTFAPIGSFLFAGGRGGGPGFYRSSDTGHSWIMPTKNVFVGPGDITGFAVCDTTLFADNYYSTNYGVSWNQMSITGQAFTVSGDTIIAAPGLNISTDKGVNWSSRPIANAHCVAIMGTLLFVGTQQGLISRSTNWGTSWDTVFSQPTSSINAFQVVGSNLFAGTYDSGVYLSPDSGRTWTPERTGLIGIVTATCFAVMDSFLIMGTGETSTFFGQGPYRCPLSQMIGQKSAVQQTPPDSTMLAVYPNPLTSSAMITYSLAQECRVSMAIIDQLGRTIAFPIVGESQGAGTYSIGFDGNNVPSGIYWCRLTAGSEDKFTKFIINR